MVSNSPIRTAARGLLIAAALVAPVALLSATSASAQVVISVGFGPPALPVYAQPICPGEGYLWTPGYWAYGDEGYFWVPGTWVYPPQIGYLWTPGYWGWGGSAFLFHTGYWGPHIGFYGGINYGFGYGGVGYEGGYWRDGEFAYNRSVNNINIINIHNVYNQTVVVNNVNYNHVSYNGGNGGVPSQASAQEQAALRDRHIQPTSVQVQHRDFAAQNRQQLASVNHGRPAVTAAPTPAAFRANPANPAAATVNRTAPVVNQREGNQQQRIANGVRSGQLTSGEAARVDQRQANIDRQIHNDRTANGGTLTPQERQQVNREQNNASRQIYNQKHDTAVQPRVQPQAQPRTQPQFKPRQESQLQPRPQAQPQYQPRPQVQPQPRPQTQPQYQPRPQVQPQPRQQPQPQYQPRPQSQPQPRQPPQPQYQPRPQAQPQPRQQAQPQPQSRPAPPAPSGHEERPH